MKYYNDFVKYIHLHIHEQVQTQIKKTYKCTFFNEFKIPLKRLANISRWYSGRALVSHAGDTGFECRSQQTNL